jgi:hypothetical protein
MTARTLIALGTLALLSLGSGLVSAAQATFTAQAGNPGSRYAFTALYPPGSLTATPLGHDVSLGWTAGSNGRGYSILGAANGASSDCSSAVFTSVGSTSGTTFTDSGRFTPQGTYYCYQVKTTYASWTSVNGNPTAAALLGFVTVTTVASNGGTTGRLDTGDKVVLTFNQAMSTATGPSGTNTVCAIAGATIVLGATAATGTCSASETNNLGKLTGGTSAANGRWSATWVWSAGNTVLTATLGARVSGTSTATTSGAWTFNPSTTTSKLQSATGAFHICDTNTGGGNCLPGMTGAF